MLELSKRLRKQENRIDLIAWSMSQQAINRGHISQMINKKTRTIILFNHFIDYFWMSQFWGNHGHCLSVPLIRTADQCSILPLLIIVIQNLLFLRQVEFIMAYMQKPMEHEMDMTLLQVVFNGLVIQRTFAALVVSNI